MWHPALGLAGRDHPVMTMAGPALWLAQGPPEPYTGGAYGRAGFGYNPIAIGQATTSSWWDDPCHKMWVIAGALAVGGSALGTYYARKKKPGARA